MGEPGPVKKQFWSHRDTLVAVCTLLSLVFGLVLLSPVLGGADVYIVKFLNGTYTLPLWVYYTLVICLTTVGSLLVYYTTAHSKLSGRAKLIARGAWAVLMAGFALPSYKLFVALRGLKLVIGNQLNDLVLEAPFFQICKCSSSAERLDAVNAVIREHLVNYPFAETTLYKAKDSIVDLWQSSGVSSANDEIARICARSLRDKLLTGAAKPVSSYSVHSPIWTCVNTSWAWCCEHPVLAVGGALSFIYVGGVICCTAAALVHLSNENATTALALAKINDTQTALGILVLRHDSGVRASLSIDLVVGRAFAELQLGQDVDLAQLSEAYRVNLARDAVRQQEISVIHDAHYAQACGSSGR